MKELYQIWINLPETYKGIILGGLIAIIGGLIGAYYSSNRNWKQQKYFKLQSISEEIVVSLWKYQDYDLLYKQKKEEVSNLSKKTSSGLATQSLIKEYELMSNKLEEISNLKQECYHKLFSKIQIYFSEFGLNKVRDISVRLSKAINGFQLTANNDREISNISIQLKDEIIKSVKRYGRSKLKNILYYRVEKYN